MRPKVPQNRHTAQEHFAGGKQLRTTMYGFDSARIFILTPRRVFGDAIRENAQRGEFCLP